MFRCATQGRTQSDAVDHFLGTAPALHSGRCEASRARLPSPQPNDLWRFFPSSVHEPVAEQDLTNPSVADALLRLDTNATSRAKEVQSFMELYEKATESWGKPQKSCRKWFPAPEEGVELSPPPRPTSYQPLTKPGFEGATLTTIMEPLPTWRVLSAAVFLSTASKQLLLERCQAKLGRISADHMTLMHCPDAASLVKIPLGRVVKLMAYGEKCGIVAQHVAIKPPSDLLTQKAHPHITVSFAERVLKKDIAATKGKGSFEKWALPVALEGVVGLKMDSQRILFSDEEFFVETGVDLKALRKCAEADSLEPSREEELVNSEPCVEQSMSTGARPSEEIRRLLAQDSFLTRRVESTVPSCHITEMCSTQSVASGSSGVKPASPETAAADVQVLRVSRQTTLQLEAVGQASPRETKQQEIKTRQADLRCCLIEQISEQGPLFRRAESEVHRQAAWRAQRKGADFLHLARQAYREGNREKGDEYNRVSAQASLEQREHADRAEQLAFEASNLGRVNTHTVDLHHLHLQEALAHLKKVVDGLRAFVADARSAYRLRVITGKGMNSTDGIPILRPAVLEFLTSHGLHAEIEGSNEGVVLAFLHPEPRTTVIP